MRKILFAAIVLTIGLVSCSKDEDGAKDISTDIKKVWVLDTVMSTVSIPSSVLPNADKYNEELDAKLKYLFKKGDVYDFPAESVSDTVVIKRGGVEKMKFKYTINVDKVNLKGYVDLVEKDLNIPLAGTINGNRLDLLIDEANCKILLPQLLAGRFTAEEIEAGMKFIKGNLRMQLSLNK